jgi:hypothetical protein
MIELTTAQWNLLLATYLYPFVRVMGYISADPVLGNRSVPIRLKIGLALAISVAIAPTLGPLPAIEPASPAGLAILAQQIFIGVAIGFAVRVILAAVEMAGQMIGLQMGLGFATFFDPQTSAQVPVIGQYLGLLAILVFLSINGHALVLSTLIESFHILPIGTLGLGRPDLPDRIHARAAGDRDAADRELRHRDHLARGAADEHLRRRLSVHAPGRIRLAVPDDSLFPAGTRPPVHRRHRDAGADPALVCAVAATLGLRRARSRGG